MSQNDEAVMLFCTYSIIKVVSTYGAQNEGAKFVSTVGHLNFHKEGFVYVRIVETAI